MPEPQPVAVVAEEAPPPSPAPEPKITPRSRPASRRVSFATQDILIAHDIDADPPASVGFPEVDGLASSPSAVEEALDTTEEDEPAPVAATEPPPASVGFPPVDGTASGRPDFPSFSPRASSDASTFSSAFLATGHSAYNSASSVASGSGLSRNASSDLTAPTSAGSERASGQFAELPEHANEPDSDTVSLTRMPPRLKFACRTRTAIRAAPADQPRSRPRSPSPSSTTRGRPSPGSTAP
jgi:hypothetical protein